MHPARHKRLLPLGSRELEQLMGSAEEPGWLPEELNYRLGFNSSVSQAWLAAVSCAASERTGNLDRPTGGTQYSINEKVNSREMTSSLRFLHRTLSTFESSCQHEQPCTFVMFIRNSRNVKSPSNQPANKWDFTRNPTLLADPVVAQ